MDAVHRRAMELIELPTEKREERYAYYRRVYYEGAKADGASEVQARELSESMDEWVRALVAIIETGGGAEGGRA
jgi:hypothetical protein